MMGLWGLRVPFSAQVCKEFEGTMGLQASLQPCFSVVISGDQYVGIYGDLWTYRHA